MTMPASNNTAARRYLDLLRHALCRDRFPDARYDMSSGSLKLMPFDPALRAQGRDWPLEAVTMVGTKRLENLETGFGPSMSFSRWNPSSPAESCFSRLAWVILTKNR
jgi:Macrocin-O-methyltransferase (TylF)